MATITIPRGNWTMYLPDAIENAVDGDTIIVHTPEMKELAEIAIERMCPNKSIKLECEELDAVKVWQEVEISITRFQSTEELQEILVRGACLFKR